MFGGGKQTFGAASNSGFGAYNNNTANTGPFGGQSAFGKSATPGFGQQPAFGQQPSLFGQTQQTGGLFGAPAATTQQTGFGGGQMGGKKKTKHFTNFLFYFINIMLFFT